MQSDGSGVDARLLGGEGGSFTASVSFLIVLLMSWASCWVLSRQVIDMFTELKSKRTCEKTTTHLINMYVL